MLSRSKLDIPTRRPKAFSDVNPKRSQFWVRAAPDSVPGVAEVRALAEHAGAQPMKRRLPEVIASVYVCSW
jgi:hypothetical protein